MSRGFFFVNAAGTGHENAAAVLPPVIQKLTIIIPCLRLKIDNANAKKTFLKETRIMKSNSVMVPEAKEAMEQFKMQAASEVGVNLKQGYNGDITARQAGSVGGQMVKKMIESYEKGLK